MKRPLRFKTKIKQNKNTPKSVLDQKKKEKKEKEISKNTIAFTIFYMLNSLSHRILKTFIQNASFYKARHAKLTLGRAGLEHSTTLVS